MLPYRRFAAALTGDCARLGADVVRYSFIVSDLHRLLVAGLPAHCEKFWTLPRARFSHTKSAKIAAGSRARPLIAKFIAIIALVAEEFVGGVHRSYFGSPASRAATSSSHALPILLLFHVDRAFPKSPHADPDIFCTASIYGCFIEHPLKKTFGHNRYNDFTDELTNFHTPELCLER